MSTLVLELASAARTLYSLRLSWEGDVQDTIAHLPGYEEYVTDDGYFRPLYGKTTHLAVFHDRVYFGTADQLQFEVWSAGRGVRLLDAEAWAELR
jgi:hypothetical protein